MKFFQLKPMLIVLSSLFFSYTLLADPVIGPPPEKLLNDTCLNTVVLSAKGPQNSSSAGLGDYLTVKVEGLNCLFPKGKQQNRPLVLFLNNIPMHGIYAEDFNPTGDSIITFKLVRDSVSMKAWEHFYTYPRHTRLSVTVSVGFEDLGAVKTNVGTTKGNQFFLIVFHQGLFYWAIILGLLVLGVFIYYAITGNIIRDPSTSEIKGEYSLARSQLAFWTILIVFCFVFIWVITGDYTSITGSTLVLLGISITTTTGAKIIESGKDKKSDVYKTKNFFSDILSDDSGISIHRFQMVVWTLVLGAMFLRSVIINLAMPQFDETLLALMGISSGAYLGLKIPENKAGNPPS